MIAMKAFSNSWDNFFRIAMTANLATLKLQIFPFWLKIKPKPTNETIFFLLKSFHFLLVFPLAAITQNIKNTLKLNIPF